MHVRSHDRTLLFGVRPLRFQALINIKHYVVGYVLRVLTSLCVALLCQLVSKLLMCLFVQHDSRCRYVSIPFRLQRLHNGEMSCLSMWYFL